MINYNAKGYAQTDRLLDKIASKYEDKIIKYIENNKGIVEISETNKGEMFIVSDYFGHKRIEKVIVLKGVYKYKKTLRNPQQL